MRYLSMVIHNAVPLVGVLLFEWSAFTLLALFWWDGFLVALLDSVRIAVHRRLTNDPAHRTGASDHSGRRFQWVSTPPGRGSYLRQHLRGASTILLICGAGLALTYTILTSMGIAVVFEPDDFARGAAALAAIALIELFADLRTLRTRSFLWLQIHVGSLAVGLLALTLLVGVPLAIWFHDVSAAFVVLVLLKILVDCAVVIYDDHKARLWPAGWDERTEVS